MFIRTQATHQVVSSMVVPSLSTPTLLQQERATIIPNTAYACPLPSAPTPTAQQTTTIHACAGTQDVAQQVDIIAIALTINVLRHPLRHASTRMVQLQVDLPVFVDQSYAIQ